MENIREKCFSLSKKDYIKHKPKQINTAGTHINYTAIEKHMDS